MANFFRKLLTVQYATAKNMVPMFSKNQNGLSTAMTLMLTLLIMVTTVIIFVPSVLFRFCLYLTLKVRYGNLFGGFLNGIERLFERTQPCICEAIVIYSCKSDESKRINALERYINQVHNSSWRYSCIIKKSWGYHYFIKNQVKSKDILEIVKGPGNSCMTKSVFYDYIENKCAELKTGQMWKLTAFQQPISWSETPEKLDHQYAMIITTRHSLADGPSILGSLKQFLDVECENNKKINLDNSNPKVSWADPCLRDAKLYRNPLTARLEGRALKLKTYSRWHVGIFTEQDQKLVPLIKEIRKKLNVQFVDVIMAAFISSIDDYITERKVKLDSISAYCTIRPEGRGVEEILNKRYGCKELKNNFGIANYSINFGTIARSMKDRMLMINDISEMFKKSVDHMMFDVFSYGLLSYAPPYFLKILCSKCVDYATVNVTNLVGFERSTYCGGTIDDIMLFPIDCNNIGYFLTTFTYGGRLGITISAGRGFVHNRKEVEAIVNNTVMYLHQAAKEVLDTSSTDMN